MTDTCRIATRASPLAVCQAELIAAELARTAGVRCELVRIRTEGDRTLDRSLSEIGGKGLFLKELEQSLLRGDTDLAVHSMKDVPAQLPRGLALAAICARADARDALVCRHGGTLEDLPEGSRVGTSSLRRQSQLRALRPDLRLLELRGNLGTRMRRLEEGDFDAIVLACAGLDRLGQSDRISERLSPQQCLPAIGQGALGIEIARDHPKAQQWVEPLGDPISAAEVETERAVARELHADCRTPLAAHATRESTGDMHLQACLASPDGSRMLRAQGRGTPEEAAGEAVRALLAQGAGAILAELGVPGFS